MPCCHFLLTCVLFACCVPPPLLLPSPLHLQLIPSLYFSLCGSLALCMSIWFLSVHLLCVLAPRVFPVFQICSSGFSYLSSVFVLLWYFPMPACLGHQLIKALFWCSNTKKCEASTYTWFAEMYIGNIYSGFPSSPRLIRSPAGKTNTESFKTSVLFFIACVRIVNVSLQFCQTGLCSEADLAV